MADLKPRVDRREFLQASAVAGLAVVASSATDTADAQESPDPPILNQPAGAPLRVRRVVTGHHADGELLPAEARRCRDSAYRLLTGT